LVKFRIKIIFNVKDPLMTAAIRYLKS
jgi:hypothetical protein